jgi:hypothetical protein
MLFDGRSYCIGLFYVWTKTEYPSFRTMCVPNEFLCDGIVSCLCGSVSKNFPYQELLLSVMEKFLGSRVFECDVCLTVCDKRGRE